MMEKKIFIWIVVIFLELYFLTLTYAEVITLKSNKNSEEKILTENKVAKGQQVLEYLNKSNFIMESMNKKIAEQQILLTQASMTRNIENMRTITTNMKNIVTEHKQQFLALSVPVDCEELYSVTLRWYELQETIHDELIKGNNQEAKLLTQQLIEYFYKIKQESNRLLQYYGQPY